MSSIYDQLISGSDPKTEYAAGLAKDFSFFAAIVSLRKAYNVDGDHETKTPDEIMVDIIEAWKNRVVTNFEEQLVEFEKRMDSPIGKLFGAIDNDHIEEKKKIHQEALDEILIILNKTLRNTTDG